MLKILALLYYLVDTHACRLAIILCMGVAMLQFTFSSSLVGL